ncbi:MAG TPA: YdeI/OmpD-associated family protein [archaeon]|nr:YdeI/OmpD-associated family protein [archaeon]
MTKKEIATGVVHKVPADMRRALSSQAVRNAWNDLTPLSRNEWICWITSVKKSETRRNHIERACAELIEGKRRPCCWPGCHHRRKILKNKKSIAV